MPGQTSGHDGEDWDMNWISEVVRPKIKTLFKRETPENLWVKCPDTGQMVFQMQLAKRPDAVPLTRDYILDWERAHMSAARARLRAVP